MTKKGALFLTSAISVIISTVIAGGSYLLISKHGSVLGTQTSYVTFIKKEDLLFPSLEELKYYYEPKPNVTYSEKPDWLSSTATYTINSEGMNNLSNYSVDKPADTFRIIVLGDSFTFGQYVNTQDNYVSKLEQLLTKEVCSKKKKIEVLNLGMAGYDLQYSVERFARHGQKYHPDLVIWLINEHNLLQIRELLTPLEQKYQQEATAQEKQSYISQKMYYFAANKATADLEKQYGEDNILAQQEKFLQRFNSLYSGPLALFMFSQSSDHLKEVVDQYASSRGNAYFFDDIPNIYGTDNALPDGHPSQQGHTMIASTIHHDLLSQKLLPCE